MKALSFLALFLSFFVILPACGKKPQPSPAPVAAPSAPAPAAPAPAVPPAPAPGEWKGESGDKLPLNFSVQENKVSSLYASYSGRNGSCSFSGGFSSKEPSPINGKSFTAQGKNEGIEFNLNGSFTSDNEASGTIVWKGKSGLCGEVNLEHKWVAKKEAAEAPEAPDVD